jgi:DNA (cytosine-5)-methyltransferase 1
MIYGSICSGIEAASVAWHPLGWKAAFLSEIETFPRAVLQHHYPDVPLHGDFTTIQGNDYAAIDVLVGGTPCQSFSVAGLRQGFADQRGNLTLEFVRLAQRLRPRWLVWENVPGVLSIDEGRAFGSFVGGLGECGYGFAYRILDAQYFGVPQRRRRVFVVGYLGDWRPPAAVLFERDCLRRDLTPSRQARERASCDVAPSLTGSGRGVERIGESRGQDPVVAVSTSGAGYWREGIGALRGRTQDSHENLVAHALRADGFDASEDGTGRGTPLVPMTLAIRGGSQESRLEIRQDGVANAILTPNGGRAGTGVGAIAFYPTNRQPEFGNYADVSPTVKCGGGGQSGNPPGVLMGMAVRRLTPRECERLQGFPDDYTLIDWYPTNKRKLEEDFIKYLMRGGSLTKEECYRKSTDGSRYKALGNSMAVPVMRWIGERIQFVESLIHAHATRSGSGWPAS